MSIYFKNTTDEIKKELEARKCSAMAELDAWENVTIKKKKDGSEFLQLSRALENAKETYEYGFHRLTVYYHSRGYEHSYIDIYGYADELPDTDPRSELAKKQGFLRAQYDFTADEVREAIEKRKDYLHGYITSLEKQLGQVDALSAKYREALETAERELSQATKDGLYNNDLYYLITEMR